MILPVKFAKKDINYQVTKHSANRVLYKYFKSYKFLFTNLILVKCNVFGCLEC